MLCYLEAFIVAVRAEVENKHELPALADNDLIRGNEFPDEPSVV